MKRLLTILGVMSAATLSLLLAGCSTTQNTENMLVTAGFRNIQATTPQQQSLLASLPAGQVSTVLKDNKTYYVYPSQKTNSAYVGTQTQYTTFRQLLFVQNISDQNLMAAQMNSAPGWGGAWAGGGWGWR
ncbi:hypothetical protein AYO41_03290 [Verrucomicrobia bacterium SCGC AG-212-E04]|nr:hypothetical protein AYO41_03290 [Verrucomicrobia bacterium SCGC AG-212-E04]